MDPSIKDPTWFMPDYPALRSRDDVGKAAVSGQYIEYPQTVRSMTDPGIANQSCGNLSFMIFKEP